MSTFLFILSLIAISLAFTKFLIKGKEWKWVAMCILLGWVVLLPILFIVHSHFPFTGGGDDFNYYFFASKPASLHEALDFTRFSQMMEQPGYPWLLSFVLLFIGKHLFVLKILNLAFFLMLAPIWYRVGLELESKSFARKMCLVMILLTPLWYYTFFLLKDMTITFIESLFLLGVVQIRKHHILRSWLLIISASLAIIPFRSPLVIINVTVLVGVLLFVILDRKMPRYKIGMLIFTGAIAIVLLLISSDPAIMAKMGIYAQHRIGITEVVDTAVSIGESSHINRELFPILYLFNETSGFSPETWSNFTALSLRGVGCIPWIIFGAPLFILGLFSLLVYGDFRLKWGQRLFKNVSKSLIVTSGWGGIFMFLLVFFAASWEVGDTTRWRLPDIPAMAMVALAGWEHMKVRVRYRVFLFWIIGIGIISSLLYLIRAF